MTLSPSGQMLRIDLPPDGCRSDLPVGCLCFRWLETFEPSLVRKSAKRGGRIENIELGTGQISDVRKPGRRLNLTGLAGDDVQENTSGLSPTKPVSPRMNLR